MCATVGNRETGRKEDAMLLFRDVACLKCQPLLMGTLVRGIVKPSLLDPQFEIEGEWERRNEGIFVDLNI